MDNARLLFEQRLRAGERIRLWHQGEGRYLFEHLMPTGKGRTIPCATLEEVRKLIPSGNGFSVMEQKEG